ncbi:hypothetical protein DCC85_09990 [Paenibacillus sp. CAA11]|uniref:FAD-dependent oxidoreductase n=1 Tax=Paenibacillus sp. CAA11 TaxID=1532905 RepID=UPI000D3C6B22|nr:FAD-dependent oxidoreductase [Paenibacillus sp. CAA11]AWB44524.1 hypothetical protein DCC85_09990 [Paenibacillus sp. CAA11]
MLKRWHKLVMSVLLIVGLCGGYYGYKEWKHHRNYSQPAMEELEKVSTAKSVKDQYDVIVVGTDPEGIAAAISASRQGLHTLLIEDKQRPILGGLMTLGWLNSIDMNWDSTGKSSDSKKKPHPDYLNKGIFKEWYERVGGHSFNINNAANAFNEMVKHEQNLDLYMSAKAIEPIVQKIDGSPRVTGITATLADGSTEKITASSLIDATQDADIAAAAGVKFTVGREDLGDKNTKMAVTAVFRIKNFDASVWKAMKQRMLSSDNSAEMGMNQSTVWGYNKEMKGYQPVNKERTAVRGLNLGRQGNDTALINAMYVFGVDGLSKESKEEALNLARQEAPHIVSYLNKKIPELKSVQFDAVAPELYIRETRHMIGLYRLNIIDLLENRDQWDRIAFGSYPVDIQRSTPNDHGAIVLQPVKYAVPFRSLVPRDVDGILVVGRSASYDSLAHGSARVIPVGMAEGEAAGAAAKLIKEKGITYRELAGSRPLIAELQDRLNKGGMELEPYSLPLEPYMKHKDYAGLKAAVYIGGANGGYHNLHFQLDDPSTLERMVQIMKLAARKYPKAFPGDLQQLSQLARTEGKKALTLDDACYTVALVSGLKIEREEAMHELLAKGFLSNSTVTAISDSKKLTNGESYLILKDALNKQAGVELQEMGIKF